jgi:hypothetical protein
MMVFRFSADSFGNPEIGQQPIRNVHFGLFVGVQPVRVNPLEA